MARYVVLVVYEPQEWAAASPEARQSYGDAHRAFERYVDVRGRRLASGALADADMATTVGRGVGAERPVTDGPFAELAGQIGGYYDVELPDLDTAIAAVRRLPAAYTVEVRPVVTVERYASV